MQKPKLNESSEGGKDAVALARRLAVPKRVRSSKKHHLDDPVLGLGTSPVGKRPRGGPINLDWKIYKGR
jgi:hypothetical protein